VHDDHRVAEGRLARALRERIRPAMYARSAPLEVRAWHVQGEPVPVAQALAATYEPFPLDTAWGTPWSTTWFAVSGEVPAAWAGARVEVVADLGFTGDVPGFQAEGLVHDRQGVPVKGLAPRNAYVPVAAPARGGERIDLLIEAAANPTVLSGGWDESGAFADFRPNRLGDGPDPAAAPLYRLRRMDLAVLDEDVVALVHDLEVLQQLMEQLPLDQPRRHEVLRAVTRALDVLDLTGVASGAGEARKELAEALSRPASASAHRISAVGHAHIDSAWLWPVRETKRKCARTFANVTALAREYPELVFACSSAQQYAWVKEFQPQIFERIKDAVRAGSWAPVGSMWVESDANMPGGEALVRQLVHGKRFFREELGVDTREVWLPDSFGYSGAFPQLARLAGARWFLTQKLSWNQVNRLPHHSFWWEGIDGTQIFTHFPPADTYNAEITGEELARASRLFADKGPATRSLLPFGHGDGGGGPTREMLERARRVADLEGSPRVRIQTPADFFTEAEAEYADEAPVWSGELYLEFHRGTYTSQASTKRGNRRSEHLLREAELWSATAALRAGSEYPYERLERVWQIVLLQQFHDILPGSSIGWVHREAAENYAGVAGELHQLMARAFGEGQGLVLANAAPQDRAEVAVLPPGVAAPPSAQALSDGATAVWVEVPALGAGAPGSAPAQPVRAFSDADRLVLENGVLRVSVDRRGLLASVVDLSSGREALAPGGSGNQLQLHPDLPNQWDAWDVDAHYRRVHVDLDDAESVELVDVGPMLARVKVVRRFGASRVEQLLGLAAGSSRVDIDTEVDWREDAKILKAAFPLDVHAEQSLSEVQFGHVARPTHVNTSWEAARFELCAHRFTAVREPGYGHAIVNDSTYGHDVTRSTRPSGGTTTTVRLSLLRAPRFPDADADRGTHRLRYGLVVGGTLGDAVAAGYSVNLPLRPVRGPEVAPLVTVEGTGVLVEAVKLAEDRSGDLVVRLYESLGGRAGAVVRVDAPVGEPWVADLLEEPLEDAALRPRVLGTAPAVARLELRPFQVVTLRFPRRDVR
jgi:alpha-mannosidase